MRTPLVMAAVAALAVAGCSVSVGSTLDTEKAAEEISQGIEDQTGQSATVDCPSDVAINEGASFTCTATFEDGSAAPVLVTQQDDQGNITWELNPGNSPTAEPEPTAAPEPDGAALDPDLLATQIAQQAEAQTGVPVTVTCPPGVPIEAGRESSCTLVDNTGASYTVTVIQQDDQGNVVWELVN